MRIHHSTTPAHAHGKNASSVDASQRSTSTAVETTTAGGTENTSAPAKAAGKPEQPESEGKLTPAGLLAAQLRFQSMNSEDMNKGQTRALEVINRNIERYNAKHGITTPPPATETTPPATDTTPSTGDTAETTPATGTEQSADTGTISTPQPTTGSEPTTVSTDSTPAATQITAA